MYTSGTTGNPKGVLLSHKAINVLVSATRSPTGALGGFVKPGYRYMAYLPLAHIMELAVEIALLSAGYTIGYGSTGTFIPTAPKMLHANQKGDAQASVELPHPAGHAHALSPSRGASIAGIAARHPRRGSRCARQGLRPATGRASLKLTPECCGHRSTRASCTSSQRRLTSSKRSSTAASLLRGHHSYLGRSGRTGLA